MTDELLNQEDQEEVVENPVQDDPEPTPQTPTPPTLADKVKLALRISHNLLDGEIADVITSARQELIRAGVNADVVNETAEDVDAELVETAIKTYALEYYTRDVNEAKRYAESFQYQCDSLRKTYPSEVIVDV